MSYYGDFLWFLDHYLINGLPASILVLLLVAMVFKGKFESQRALNCVRWIIIWYAAISVLYFLLRLFDSPQEFETINLPKGEYAVWFWIVIFGSTVLPFTLLKPKLATKFWYVLLIAFCLKLGYFIENLMIFITSFHRDYLEDSTAFNWPITGVLFWFFKGFVIAILVLVIFEIVKRTKRHTV